jgi:predicted transcriptional regulator
MASRVANTLNKQGAISMEDIQDSEEESDTWYIRNPFKAGTTPGINTPMYESLKNVIKEELLNEVTYHRFKNEVKFRTKNEQLHKAIREVKRKLSEIDRIVEYTSRMKQELSEGEEGVRYWKATQKNVATISEMVNQLNNKIKNLQQ